MDNRIGGPSDQGSRIDGRHLDHNRIIIRRFDTIDASVGGLNRCCVRWVTVVVNRILHIGSLQFTVVVEFDPLAQVKGILQTVGCDID